jgi:hypothetical protein
MNEDLDKELGESDFLRREIHAIINRYSTMTVYQVLGVLKAVEMDIWDQLETFHTESEE